MDDWGQFQTCLAGNECPCDGSGFLMMTQYYRAEVNHEPEAAAESPLPPDSCNHDRKISDISLRLTGRSLLEGI